MEENTDLENLLNKYGENHQWTKNQHYVPQFYLKYFSNSEGKVETYDIKNKKILKPQSISHICSAEFFYGIKTGEKDKLSQLLEDYFTDIENYFAQRYDKIISNLQNYNDKVDEKLIFNLCEFIVISYLRSKYFRETLFDMSEDTMKGMMKWLTENKAFDTKNEEFRKVLVEKHFNVSFDNSFHIRFLIRNIEKFTHYLYNKKIMIYISDGEKNFVTSDCCVKEITPERKGPFGVGFLERFHYFAVSPKILVEFYNPELPGKDRKRKRIGKRDVIFFNYINSRQGNYLYGKSKNDLLVKEHIIAHYKHIDDLYNLYPTKYKIDKNFKDHTISTAMNEGLSKSDAEDFYVSFAIKRGGLTSYFK